MTMNLDWLTRTLASTDKKKRGHQREEKFAIKRQSKRRQLLVESLETRALLAADYTLLKDISPAAGDEPYGMTAVGSIGFFVASTAAEGLELWKTDGTTAGTVLVKDIVSGVDSSAPSDLTNVNGTLFFSAAGATANRDLWKSDGTLGGTVMVAQGVVPSDLLDIETTGLPIFAAVGSTLYFRGIDATNGTELWKSDGTAGGTLILKNINSGTNSSSPGALTAVGTTLYFSADDGTTGRELWKSDGTTVTTVRVADIIAGATGSAPTNFAAFNNKLYFSAMTTANGNELWTSDGTSAGTALVSDIIVGAVSSLPTNLTVLNGKLFFATLSTVGAPQLWSSDGTSAGTTSVFTGFTTSQIVFDTGPFTVLTNTAYISVFDDNAGLLVYKSNGTAAGTVPASELTAGTSVSDPTAVANVNGILYYVGTTAATGTEYQVRNRAPTAVNLSPSTVKENSANATLVGALLAVDPNGADTFTYSFVSGTGSTNNNLFSISGSQILVNGAINFEATPTLSVRVRATDNGNNTFDQQLTVTVTNAPEVQVTETGGTTAVTEGGATDQVSVVLDAIPTANVVVTITPNAQLDLGSGAGVAVTRTFTTANWNVAQNITVTAFNDTVVEGAHNGSISFSVSSSDTNYNAQVISPISVAITDNDLPRVAAVTFGDGTTQRSMVRSITVDFNTIVAVAANAFTLERRVSGVWTAIPTSQLTINPTSSPFNSNTQTRTVLTFSGTSVIGGSLSDGNYRLTVNAAAITAGGQTLDGDGNGVTGDNYVAGSVSTDKFFRLFGDANGDRAVSNFDIGRFRLTNGLSSANANFNSAFDYQSDNAVSNADIGQFRIRNGTSLIF